ncbi:RNA polymerase sigma factor [Dyadobacter sp. CY323]|uniref:RNA polymerase sigma factor n=1 Tax=Dyadobacter sp. CY323 TaxID=2907302 RepID=UPI001F19D65B|nr:sigma-70 family RNA polymerase sigma factor [Dyadobacter sp. CY323]MCE6992642.1 sigma-70 family RNA polymerase sigma factor [Dyadobacter sp. CY323]
MRHLPLHGEQELLYGLARGDERAFRAIFHNYSDLLGKHILRITRSQELTEEIVQDVFLKVWMKREELAEVRDFRAYLFILSRNYAINYLKKTVGILLSEQEPDWVAVENISVYDQEHEADYYTLIDEAIDLLPPQQQKVYLLSRHERLKYHEIASRLNLSRETVKKYLQIATESVATYVRKGFIALLLIFFQ